MSYQLLKSKCDDVKRVPVEREGACEGVYNGRMRWRLMEGVRDVEQRTFYGSKQMRYG